MRCHPQKIAIVMLCIAGTFAGCAPQQPIYFRNNGDLSHYVGLAATIDTPEIPAEHNSEVESSIRPFSLAGPAPKDFWELKLEDAVKTALQNAKVMRSIGAQVQGPPAFLTANPNAAPTVYDPEIVETDARFGIPAGESLFDPTLTTNFFWERNHEPLNVNPNLVAANVSAPDLQQNAFSLQTAVSKTTADGTVLSVSQSTSYDMRPTDPTRAFPQDWLTAFQIEMTTPLLQGRGVEFNEIAGPGAIPGFNQGVLIARVNTDIALTAFEGAVRNMVSDVESAYWELYYSYRNLDAAVEGRDDSLRTWQKANANYIHGTPEGTAAAEAQAREQFFLFRSTAEQAQLQLYQAEGRLRFLMGIPATDGRLIRPKDDPTTAKITFDWTDVQGEAMARSVEIREARWRIKQRDMELIAAKNFLLPRVDLQAYYRWSGMGERLVDPGNDGLSGGAVDNLGSGQFQDWHIGIRGSVPLGFRKQISGVENAEAAAARDRAKLHDIELEVSHQVAYAVRDMEANYVLTVSNFNRRAAAERNVAAVEAAYDNGTVQIDILLNAQRSLAQAESDYFRSLTNYAKAISQVHYRKGSLLEYNGVFLTEGPWPAKAYFDARRRAHARSAALYLDYGMTCPKVLSRGPVKQFTGQSMGAEEMPSTPPSPIQPEQPPLRKPEFTPAPPAGVPGPALEPAQTPAAPSDAVPTGVTVLTPPPERKSHDIGSFDLNGLAPANQ